MAKSSSIKPDIQRNSYKVCFISSCARGRAGVSRYCDKHKDKQRKYGSPEGRPLSRVSDYGGQLSEVSRFINTNISHQGIQTALKWVETWLNDATTGLKVPGKRSFRNLSDYGVSPLSILIEATSIYLYWTNNPHILQEPDELDCALTVGILRLAPSEGRDVWVGGEMKRRYRKVGSLVRREIGSRIRKTLGGLFINIAIAIREAEEEQRRFARDLRAQFSTVGASRA